ncbi:MAG: hypothetical protein AMR96_03385 [Candidatus Adiutrix intracellularis]|nr:MAG: hypothetical protein AMR96_03385 [Candidatus Adiutrix intracellularis]
MLVSFRTGVRLTRNFGLVRPCRLVTVLEDIGEDELILDLLQPAWNLSVGFLVAILAMLVERNWGVVVLVGS